MVFSSGDVVTVDFPDVTGTKRPSVLEYRDFNYLASKNIPLNLLERYEISRF